ncbi:MAG: hypothetical protein JNM26_04170 [Ideonella sp.]|nr:hypothetical protein [Ideonella sp.]
MIRDEMSAWAPANDDHEDCGRWLGPALLGGLMLWVAGGSAVAIVVGALMWWRP